MDVLSLIWPESFNNLFSWKWFEKLRYKDSPYIPVLGQNPHYLPKDHAWHMDIPTVFPHTKRHRAMRAICRDDLTELQQVLNEGFDINSEVELTQKRTPLGLAAYLGRPRLIRYLILRGAEIEKGDIAGNTPLIDTVERVNFECLMELLQNGADSNRQNKFGKTAMGKASEKGLLNIQKLFTEAEANKTKPITLPHHSIGFKFEYFLARRFSNKAKRVFFTQGNPYPFNTVSGPYIVSLYNEVEI